MNMAVCLPTETEMAALKQRRSFQDKIAIRAAALAASKLPSAALNPEAMPAETDPPKERHWFKIVDEVRRFPSVARIQETVAGYYGVTRADICSDRRQKEIILPRHVAVYLAREMTPLSLPTISRYFGGRDHTTSLSAIRKISMLVRRDWVVAFDVAALTEALIAP